MYQATRKESPTIGCTCISFCPADHYSIEAVAIIDHIFFICKKGRIQQPDQHPESEMIALMRCRREEKQISAMITHSFCQFIIQCFGDSIAVSICSQVMSFIKYNEIPSWRSKYFFDARLPFQSIDRGD